MTEKEPRGYMPLRERLRRAEVGHHGITVPEFAQELIRVTRPKIVDTDIQIIGLYTDLTLWQSKRAPSPQVAGEIVGETLDQAAALADAMKEFPQYGYESADLVVHHDAETARIYNFLRPAYQLTEQWERAGIIGEIRQTFRTVTGYQPKPPPIHAT